MTTAAPKLRSDLVMSRQGGFVVVKDPAAGRFFRFGEVDHFIASQFDGSTSVGEIRERTRQKFGADRKSTRLNSSHGYISYAVFCLKKKKKMTSQNTLEITNK